MTVALECVDLSCGYRRKTVVRNFSLALRQGEITALLGPNGAGKTTLMLTLCGLLPAQGGHIDICGRASGRTAVQRNRQGVVLAADDRSLFPGLTVRQTLRLSQRRGKHDLALPLEYFPPLARKLDTRTGVLSGGEQQMVSLARALVQHPRVLLVDELSLGLAPMIVTSLATTLARFARDTGTAVLLVEQHIRIGLGIADHAIVMAQGRSVLECPAAELLAEPGKLQHAYFGSAERPAPLPDQSVGDHQPRESPP
jgi:branched-chain amino acid transport system ATP-binding protein